VLLHLSSICVSVHRAYLLSVTRSLTHARTCSPCELLLTHTLVHVFGHRYFGLPSRTGRRRVSPGAIRWLIDHLTAYFRFRLVRVPGSPPLDADDGKFIFGFHPHGRCWLCFDL
jgi:hypothetical protein